MLHTYYTYIYFYVIISITLHSEHVVTLQNMTNYYKLM